MNVRRASAEGIAAAIRSLDHVRLPSARSAARRGHKEWFHFSASTASVDVIVNFCVMDVASGTDAEAMVLPRVTLLVRDRAWVGEILTGDAGSMRAHAGDLAIGCGPNAFWFEDGAFCISVRGEDTDTAVDLRLVGDAMPAIVHNVHLGDGPPLHWMMAPRLKARGTVRVGDRVHAMDGAIAYHDHNWGRFRWGGDFAWEWGYALGPEQPAGAWSLVFTRMNDRSHHQVRRQGLFLWHDGMQRRVFRGECMRVTREGLWRPAEMCTVPPVLGLVRGGVVTDLPARFTVEADDGRDRVRADFRPEAVARVLVPADGDTGLMVIHEVAGAFAVEGRVGGDAFGFETRGVVEFLHG